MSSMIVDLIICKLISDKIGDSFLFLLLFLEGYEQFCNYTIPPTFDVRLEFISTKYKSFARTNTVESKNYEMTHFSKSSARIRFSTTVFIFFIYIEKNNIY